MTTEDLHDWFDLQLELVDALVEKCDVPFARAITQYTNLHRRLGFGRPGEATTAEWDGFVAGLAVLETRPEQLQRIKEFGKNKLISDSPSDRPEFGCFNYDPPNKHGVVRIHFAVNDVEGGTGPLSRSKQARRHGELAQMLNDIRENYGNESTHIAGASWLYNLDAYCRLFPTSFIESKEVYRSPSMTLPGMPFWGQFVDHKYSVRADLRDQFRAKLEEIKIDELWRLFPYPVYTTNAPVERFYEHFSATMRSK